MKRIPFILIALFFAVLTLFSCKKKKSGVCYCKYFSGDKKEFDFSDLPRSQQIDSCYLYNQNASHFAGECELK